MKHQTNCAGDWRVGDYIVGLNTMLMCKIIDIDNNNMISLFKMLKRGSFVEDINKYTQLELETVGFVNITEMQRALGRSA
jgi:hypothetical protein